MDEHRTRRVSEALREELSEIIGFEMEDPRLISVDVTEVHLSPDSRHASVRVGLSGTEEQQSDALEALDHARHYLRHALAGRLNLRRIPELHFEPDSGAEAEGRIEILLKRAKRRRGTSGDQP